METKTNIVELLKDCPQGMELYSPMFGKIYLEGVKDTGLAILIEVSTSCNSIHQFYPDGKYNTYYSDSECLLFPSKDQRDWSKFQRPFKDGDIITCGYIYENKDYIYTGILAREVTLIRGKYFVCDYCSVGSDGFFSDGEGYCDAVKWICLATEEEKQKLFEAIKANGYKWNAETKTLEKLVEPKFKVGDRIKHSRVESGNIYTVVATEGSSYTVNKNNEKHNFGIDFEVRDDWELVKNKFDITTLIPFESRVLVRDFNDDEWCPAIWGVYGYGKEYPHIVVSGNNFIQCIPYEKNEHLLGTTNDCDDYYKTWK